MTHITIEREKLEQWILKVIRTTKHVNNGAFVEVMMMRDDMNEVLKQALAAPVQEAVKAKHIGWDYLDNGTLVATYAVPVKEKVAPSLYTQPAPAAPVQPISLLNVKRYEPEIFREDRIRMELDSSGEWVKYADVELLIATTPAAPVQEPVYLANEVIGCFNAAMTEGLQEALAETTDERLKDLVERRLMHALYAAQEFNTTPPAAQPKAEQFTYVGFRVIDDSGIPVAVYTFNGETK